MVTPGRGGTTSLFAEEGSFLRLLCMYLYMYLWLGVMYRDGMYSRYMYVYSVCMYLCILYVCIYVCCS